MVWLFFILIAAAADFSHIRHGRYCRAHNGQNRARFTLAIKSSATPVRQRP
jgi:hypothetical protein